MAEKENSGLSLKVKIGYGMGDTFGGGALIVIGMFYLYFLTDIVRIEPFKAGLIILVSKIWDAVSDPLMGLISDRTRTRFGRRRPYFLAGVIFVFLATFMLWYPVDFELASHRFLFVLAAYLFFSTTITMVAVPYNALASELTLDYSERTSLVTVRMWFSGVSGLVCAALPLEIVKHFPDQRDGYIAMAVVLGLFFAIPFIPAFLATKERKEFMPEKKEIDFLKTFRQTFIEPFKIRTFRNVLLIYVFTFLTMDVVMAVVIYFLTYYMKMGGQANYIFGTLFVVKLLFIPVLYAISKKLDKKNACMFFIFFWMVIMIASLFMSPDHPMWLIYVFGAMIGIGVGGIGVLVYAIFPDVPDVDELYSGERREGIYSGLYTFTRKAASAVALFLVSASLSYFGYKAPVKETIDGVTKMIEQEQTSEFLLAMRVFFAALPILLLFFALINNIRYPLTPAIHKRLEAFLAKRRSRAGDPEEMAGEEAALKKALV